MSLKKKVALITPGPDQRFGMQEPLNLGFIASSLESHGIETIIIDELAGDNVERCILDFKPHVVGITATTPLVTYAYKHAALCRKLGIKTVIGGVHASVMVEEALQYADIVVKGEGELAMLDIVLNDKKDRLISHQYIQDIDTQPRPAYHLMKMGFYLRSKDRVPYNTSVYFVPHHTKVASLLTSRGCPYSCIFCHNSWKDMPFRCNSPERVIADFKYLAATYHVGAIFFCDDNFFANRPRLRKICELMKQEHFAIPWGCNARAESIDTDILKLVKDAGCKQLTFGFESGSQKILDCLDKHAKVDTNKKAIALCKEEGLLCVSTFMVGNPDETTEDIELTRRFILDNKLDCIGVGLVTPYPGTGLWKWCHEHNFIPKEFKWQDFLAESCPIQVSQYITPSQAQYHRSKIYLDFALQNRQFGELFKMSLKYPFKAFEKASRIFRHLYKKR